MVVEFGGMTGVALAMCQRQRERIAVIDFMIVIVRSFCWKNWFDYRDGLKIRGASLGWFI